MNDFGLEASEMDKIIKSIASIEGVDKAVLFGSRAKGNYKLYSDVDISLVGKSLTYSDILRLHSIIDDLLLPYEIDLNIFDLIQNENLKEHILRCGRVIYESSHHNVIPTPPPTQLIVDLGIIIQHIYRQREFMARWTY